MPENSSAAKALAWLRNASHNPSSAGEALALTIHALLTTHGFRPAEAEEESTDLPQTWTNGWGGRYRHGRSAMTFDIRCMLLGGKMIVNAVSVEDDSTVHTLELRLSEHIEWMETIVWENVLKKLNDLATLVQVQIAHRLVPDSAKEGYEASASANASNSASASNSNAQPPVVQPGRDPRVDPLRDPLHDPLRIGNPRRPLYPPVPPFGADDLMAPGLPRGLGVPPRGGGMGGNLMGPGNFGGRMDPRRPPGVPPGARFDPYGPFVPDPDLERPPGFEDEHGLGQAPRGRGAGRGGGFDEGPPPGMYW